MVRTKSWFTYNDFETHSDYWLPRVVKSLVAPAVVDPDQRLLMFKRVKGMKTSNE